MTAAAEWGRRIIGGDIRAVARAATAIENRLPDAEALLGELFGQTGRAIVLGLTGAPGAGKSTLVDALISVLRTEGKRVAVIAVDPTSPFSGGAILGDRIRMQRHHGDSGVFIRSMATRGRLGGLAPATADLTLLLDAAGFDAILIETVGVGQDEVDVARLAAATAVILTPGMGDDVQALKAGVMEIADVLVINKSDRPGADQLERELKAALSLAHRPDGWVPPIVRTVANEGQGVQEALAALRSYLASGPRDRRAKENWTLRLREMLRERLLERWPSEEFEQAAARVAARETDPYSVIHEWLERVSH